jgi:2-hydroxychromene-2-carboxylate isomerase
MSAPTVEFVYDYASPWSYLASEIIARQLPGASVQYRPVYLRGFPRFKEGIPWRGPQLGYIATDLRRCTQHYDVRVHFPSHFPVNGLYGVRGALWVQEHAPSEFADYHRAMYAAAWRDDREIGNKDIAIEVAAAAGIDKGAFAAGIELPEIKEKLKAQTEAVQQRGAFGVPTFFLKDAQGRDDLFFGHDRMEYVARAIGIKAA